MLTLSRLSATCCRCICRYTHCGAARFPPRLSGLSARRSNSTLVQRLRTIPPNSYAMLVFPCISLYLGIWQIKRRKWKIGLIEELERKQRMPGAEVPHDLSDIARSQEYEPYILHGEFNHSKQIFIGPRTLLDYNASAGGIISSGSSIGVHVVTPFKLSGREDVVLVNRGWISRKQQRSADNHQPSGEMTLKGVYRNTEKGAGDGGYDRRMNMWAKRHVAAIADTLGTRETFFDLSHSDSPQLPSNSPVPGQTNVQLRNEHMSYIITWFSLTILMLLIWGNGHLRGRSKGVHVHSLLRKGRHTSTEHKS